MEGVWADYPAPGESCWLLKLDEFLGMRDQCDTHTRELIKRYIDLPSSEFYTIKTDNTIPYLHSCTRNMTCHYIMSQYMSLSCVIMTLVSCMDSRVT